MNQSKAMNKKGNINNWQEGLKKSTSSFHVPESYFNDLETQILQKTSGAAKKSSGKITSMNSWLAMSISTAAALIIGFILLFPSNRMKDSDLTFFDDLDQYAGYSDMWIAEEVKQAELDVDDTSLGEIDALLADGVTNEEIINEYIGLNNEE